MLRKQPLEIIESTLVEFLLASSLGQAREVTSNQLDDPPLRVGMRFDVPLGGRERCVSSQKLHVSERPADGPDLPGGIGD